MNEQSDSECVADGSAPKGARDGEGHGVGVGAANTSSQRMRSHHSMVSAGQEIVLAAKGRLGPQPRVVANIAILFRSRVTGTNNYIAERLVALPPADLAIPAAVPGVLTPRTTLGCGLVDNSNNDTGD